MSKQRAEYCYSWNGEDFEGNTFDTIKAALAAAAAENDDEHTHVHVGTVERPSNSFFFPDADDVIDHMADQAYDYGNEYAADYLDVVSDEAKAELNEQLETLLDAWCVKHGVSPDFYQVGGVKEYPVPAMAE